MNKKKLAIATVIGGLIIYNVAEKKESEPSSTDLWDSQLDALWAKRVKLIDLNDFPSITKKSWCGLYFGNKSTPEQDDFEMYLKQYKNNTLSEVQSLPASNLYGNLDGYKKLSCMEPSNKSFQEKTAYYENKIQAENNKNKERSQSAWSYRVSTDEMTQKESVYLSSKTSTTTRPMSFPYTGTESSIYFACDKNSKWAYFWFSKKPNIRNDKTESGYNTSKSRISFDDNLDSITMTQEWGSQFMHVSYNNWLSKNLMGKKTLKLELDWHGEGRTVFLYDVQGFKPLYSDFIKKCSTL